MAQQAKRTTLWDSAIMAATFNGTRTQLAFSPHNDTVVIVAVDPKSDCADWKVLHTLRAHDQAIADISWCPLTNRLLTCAQDRTAYVWSQAGGEDAKPTDEWLPTTVLLDTMMKTGFTACAWALSGQKIYVGCASNTVAVGKYVEKEDWWRCTAYEAHCSAVTALAPSPAIDTVIATGSTDQTVKLTSTFNKSIDAAESRLAKLGAEVAVFDVSGWVNALSWNADGTALAVASHDSSVSIFCGPSATDFSQWGCFFVALRELPLRTLTFVNEHTVVGGGHDYYPVAITMSAKEDGSVAGWALSATGAKQKGKEKEQMSETQLARLRFQNQASLGTSESVVLPQTRHTNTISKVLRINKAKFATAAMDGRVEVWDVASLEPVA